MHKIDLQRAFVWALIVVALAAFWYAAAVGIAALAGAGR